MSRFDEPWELSRRARRREAVGELLFILAVLAACVIVTICLAGCAAKPKTVTLCVEAQAVEAKK